MAVDVSVISVDESDRWQAEHEQGGLPSQSWRYARALEASGTKAQLAVVRDGSSRMLMPFFERPWGNAIDVATTLGLSGAAILGDAGRVLNLWREFAIARGWIAGYIQLAITCDVRTPAVNDVIAATNDVFVLDLTGAEPLARTSASLRQKIRGAERAGVKPVTDRGRLAQATRDLYPAAMRRVGASESYDFAPATLEQWIGDPSSVVLGAELDGSIEAVSIFLVAGRHSEYHLNASTADGRQLTTWLIRKALVELRERGISSLNLGGGIRRGDGVYRFKERFHATIHPLRSVRQVYDRAAYETLCREAGTAAERSEWFPAYRAASSAARNPGSVARSIR